MCVPVCVRITKVVSLGGRDYRSDALPSYLLYFVLHVVITMKWMHSRSISWIGHNRGATSWSRWNQETAAKADVVGEQQLRRRIRGTVRCDHARLVLTRDTPAQGCWCVRVGGCARFAQTWW